MTAQPPLITIFVRLLAQILAEAAEGGSFAGRAAEFRVAARRDPAASSAVHSQGETELWWGERAGVQVVLDVALLVLGGGSSAGGAWSHWGVKG